MTSSRLLDRMRFTPGSTPPEVPDIGSFTILRRSLFGGERMRGKPSSINEVKTHPSSVARFLACLRRSSFIRKDQKRPLELLQALVAAGRKGAREVYLKGLEVDGLAEEFCRGVMICCRHLGSRAEGLSLYRRFEKRVKTELGIEPDSRTIAVRDSLLGEAG